MGILALQAGRVALTVPEVGCIGAARSLGAMAFVAEEVGKVLRAGERTCDAGAQACARKKTELEVKIQALVEIKTKADTEEQIAAAARKNGLNLKVMEASAAPELNGGAMPQIDS